MEIIGFVLVLWLFVHLRWIIAFIVGFAVTISADLVSGLVAGFITFWLLKLIVWWSAHCLYKTVINKRNKDGV